MNILPYEKMELVVKTLVEEFKGFELIIHPISTDNKPSLRVVIKSTPYVIDSNIRKLSQTGRIFFVEIPTDHQRLTQEGINGLFSEVILDVLKRHASSDMTAHLEDVDVMVSKSVSENEWKNLSLEYNLAFEEYKDSSSEKFPFVKITPRPMNSIRPVLYLTEPYSYTP